MQLSDYVYWIDANLPPKAANWLSDSFGIAAFHVGSLDFLSTNDNEIFDKAKSLDQKVIIISKDEDFVDVVLRKKAPPYIIWLTAGNLTNERLKIVLLANLEAAVAQLVIPGNSFIEIS